MLCVHSFAYPVNFNVAKFDNLKLALLRSTKPAATVKEAKKAPFYVIVMTRHDRAPLSPKNLAAIQMMVKALLGTGSIARYGTGAKQEGSIPPDFSNSLGIVVFNEYFFSGQSPMDSRQEAAIGINLSSTRPGYIFAINSLSKSEEWNDKSMGLFTTQGAVPWQVGNAIICAPSELQVITTIKNQTNYSGHFWDIYSNGPFVPEGPPQSRVKIQPSVLESLENRPRSPNSKIIVNRTIFWHNRLPELSYCKSMYQEECDKDILEGAYVGIGNERLIPLYFSELANVIKANIDIQICSDHQYALGLSDQGKNFQILQSNYIESTPKVVWHQDAANPATYPGRYTAPLVISPKMIELNQKLYKGSYFIHADGDPAVPSPSLSMYHQERTSSDLPPYHLPSTACLTIRFVLEDETTQRDHTFCIEVYSIPPSLTAGSSHGG